MNESDSFNRAPSSVEPGQSTRRRNHKSVSRFQGTITIQNKNVDSPLGNCHLCKNSANSLFGKLENLQYRLVCQACSKTESIDSIWIPEEIYKQVYNMMLFQKFRNDPNKRLDVQEHITNNPDVENYLIFFASELEISELKIMIGRIEFEEFIFYRMVLNFMFPLHEPNKLWCCWNFKHSSELSKYDPDVKPKSFWERAKTLTQARRNRRGLSDFIINAIGKVNSEPVPNFVNIDEYSNHPITKSTSDNVNIDSSVIEKIAKTNSEIYNSGIDVTFKMTLKGKKKTEDKTLSVTLKVKSIKSIPSLLFSTCYEYTRRIDCRMVLSKEPKLNKNAWEKLQNLAIWKKNDSKQMTQSEIITDYQPCSNCLKSSFIIPLFKLNIQKEGSDPSETQLEEVFYFKNKNNEVEIPPSFEFKLHLRRADKIKNYTETLKNYTIRPFTFWKYFESDSIMYSASMLWLLNLIAIAFYVYPVSVIFLMLISYVGYASAAQGSKIKPSDEEKRINIYFTFSIFPLYGILSLIFDPKFSLALLALLTFVAIYAGVAYYIALQSKNFRDILILTFKGDLENKKFSGISHFLKKLNRIELMKALNKVYYQVQVCQKLKDKQMVLEVSSTFSFLYVLLVILFTYFLEYNPLENLGTGSSYLTENMGTSIYGIMFIFVMAMKTVSAVAKIYFNLEITDYLDEIFMEFERMKEVLSFFEVSPELLIEEEYDGKQRPNEIVFSAPKIHNNFNIMYGKETNRVLFALQSQIREIETLQVNRESEGPDENPYDDIPQSRTSIQSDTSVYSKSKAYTIEENEEVTKEKLINWIRYHSKRSRHRIEYLDKEFRVLTEIVRYKFLGSIEIDTSFLIKFGAALATAAATSLVAVLNISFNV